MKILKNYDFISKSTLTNQIKPIIAVWYFKDGFQ